MTKASIFFSLTLLSACASIPTVNKKTSFTFDAIKHVMASAPSQKQIFENYGEPDVKEKEGDKERWRYFDPETQYDRVQFVFDRSKTLAQLYWTPLPGEGELRIERILSYYPQGSIKPTHRQTTSPDCLCTDTTYSDGSSIAILRDDGRKEVQAVVWYTAESKSADTKQNPMTSR